MTRLSDVLDNAFLVADAYVATPELRSSAEVDLFEARVGAAIDPLLPKLSAQDVADMAELVSSNPLPRFEGEPLRTMLHQRAWSAVQAAFRGDQFAPLGLPDPDSTSNPGDPVGAAGGT